MLDAKCDSALRGTSIETRIQPLKHEKEVRQAYYMYHESTHQKCALSHLIYLNSLLYNLCGTPDIKSFHPIQFINVPNAQMHAILSSDAPKTKNVKCRQNGLFPRLHDPVTNKKVVCAPANVRKS
jgi:hypothetical protein